jgi:hypothetical protein
MNNLTATKKPEVNRKKKNKKTNLGRRNFLGHNCSLA